MFATPRFQRILRMHIHIFQMLSFWNLEWLLLYRSAASSSTTYQSNIQCNDTAEWQANKASTKAWHDVPRWMNLVSIYNLLAWIPPLIAVCSRTLFPKNIHVSSMKPAASMELWTDSLERMRLTRGALRSVERWREALQPCSKLNTLGYVHLFMYAVGMYTYQI